MTDQQNPFSNMPEPPAAPDPAQAFDNAQCQGQAAQSYDVDQTAQEACDQADELVSLAEELNHEIRR